MFRPRVSLKNLTIGLAFLACALALFGVNRLAESRERDLRMRLAESRSREVALERMSSILSDRGIDVLRQASDAELLRVSAGSGGGEFVDPAQAVVTPTGVMLGEVVARRMACVLLDYRNYTHLDFDDLPEPRFGLRLRGGSSMLDVLMEASPGSAHQDIWIRVQDQSGKTLHSSGSNWKCMNDPELQKLAESILSR